jgi:bifunctional non-homologous end joining protein LigD
VAKSADRLKEYRRRRSFSRTPEPTGEEEAARETEAGGRFVVQQHDATNLHWDLRLEHDGVALSWALPRGIPQLPDRKANRLAVRTEDHPLKYLDFEGEIPAGEYGAGQMSVWDRGTYVAEKLRDKEVIATFDGKRLQGRYALFRTGGKNWIIHRMDPPLDPERELMPDDLRPMQPVRGKMPGRQRDWGFEICWGGLRTLVWCEPGHIRRSQSRGLEAETVQLFPELRRIARSLGATEAVLDGEVVVLRDGSPDPDALRRRKAAASENSARTLSKRQPATLMLYDVLFLDGHSKIELAYEERRGELEALGLEGPSWQTPSWHHGDGGALLEAARARRLPGLLAKRLGSPYRPGKRSEDWVKVMK